jgi:hypothetical protein
LSLLSLEKYLYGSREPRQAQAPASAQASNDFFFLAGGILANIERSVLVGESSADLASEVELIRTSLLPDVQGETLEKVADRLCQILEHYRERTEKANRESAEDFHKVLNMMNQAFTHINSRNEKNDTKYQYLEQSLQRVAKLNDIRTVRSQLSEVLKFVQAEGAQERESGRGVAESLSSQLQNAQQKAASRFRINLAKREEALSTIKTAAAERSDKKTYLALFVADAAASIRERHGNQVSEVMLEELARTEIHPLVTDGNVYAWSPNSVLLTWQSEADRDVVRDIAKNVKTPYEYRAFVGSRTAAFRIPLRSVVMQVQGNVNEIVGNLDHFSGGVK